MVLFSRLVLTSVFIFQCYYLGGTEDAATGTLGEMSKPLSWGVPSDKVCEKLKKKDKQVCELRYGKDHPHMTSWIKGAV